MRTADGVHLLADLGFEGGRVLPPLDDQLAPLDGLLCLEHQLVGVDRLKKVAIGPQRHRFHGRGGFLQGGQHEHLGVGPALLDLRQDFQPGTVAHGDVQRQQVGFVFLQVGDGLVGAGGLTTMEPGPGQPAANGSPRVRLVVDDQCSWRRLPAVGTALSPSQCTFHNASPG